MWFIGVEVRSKRRVYPLLKKNRGSAPAMIIYKGTHGKFGPIILAAKNKELILTFD